MCRGGIGARHRRAFRRPAGPPGRWLPARRRNVAGTLVVEPCAGDGGEGVARHGRRSRSVGECVRSAADRAGAVGRQESIGNVIVRDGTATGKGRVLFLAKDGWRHGGSCRVFARQSRQSQLKHGFAPSRRQVNVPLCSRATAEAMVSPSPMPSGLVVTNGSNRVRAISRGGPAPVSRTVTNDNPSRAPQATVTVPPCSTASRALRTRFSTAPRTRSIRPGSGGWNPPRAAARRPDGCSWEAPAVRFRP